jgi:hypothetical protein
MIRRSLLFWSGSALPLVISPTLAAAQPANEDELIRQGIELRVQGRDAEALERFERAWQLAHAPRARAQIALAEQALGRWLEAEAHLLEALAVASDPWIQRTREVLEQSLSVIRQHVGTLEIEGNAPGATIRIDGREVGSLPLGTPLRQRAGDVTLEITAEGYYSVSRRVTIPAAGVAHEVIELTPRPVVAPPLTTPPTALPFTPPVATDRGAPTRRVLAWAALGGAVAFAAGGVTFHVLREQAATRYNLGLTAGRCAGSDIAVETDATCQSDRDATATFHALTIAGYVTAGILAVTSTVLFLSGGAPRPAVAARRVACGGGPGIVGVACAVTF